jgi:hypothetical protein
MCSQKSYRLASNENHDERFDRSLLDFMITVEFTHIAHGLNVSSDSGSWGLREEEIRTQLADTAASSVLDSQGLILQETETTGWTK